MVGRRILFNHVYKHFKNLLYIPYGLTVEKRSKKVCKFIGKAIETETNEKYYVYKVSENKYLALDKEGRILRGKHVFYQAQYGNKIMYLRPYDMFISELDRKKYPGVKQFYRFKLQV